MSFTLRLVKGSALTWAEFDNNLSEIEAKWLEALDASALAQAAANFQGNWTALTGPLAVPASVRHNGEYWMLLNDLANVATSQPGVSADWSVTGNLRKSGDTMTGPLAQAAGTAALPSYTFSGDTNTGMWSPGADILAWSTAGSERLRIDTSGNVGVGTSSPATKLDVRGEVVGGNGTIQAALSFSSRAEIGAKSNHNLGFIVNGITQALLDTSGNFTLISGGGLGYGTGSGGTVTQATSKSTAVTLNKPSGVITMNNAALGAGATVSFQCSNSLVTAGDVCLLSINFGAAVYESYNCWSRCGSGAFVVHLKNTSTGSLSEALQIAFCIIKGAAS